MTSAPGAKRGKGLPGYTAACLLAIGILAASCGQTPTGTATSSPSPVLIGTATLSETGCVVEIPDRLPLRQVTIKLANNTRYTPGRFILIEIHDAHTFQELIDYGNSGQAGAPDFISEASLVDVPSNSSGEMVVGIAHAGSYAFDCGYPDDNGKVIGFLHGPMRAGTS